MQRRNARHGTYQTRAFDAGGRNVSFENKYKVRAGRNLYNTVTRDLRYDYDGDGHQVRQRVYVNGTQQTGETKYQIWSSVLGMFISETDHGGGKVTTKVTANGSVIAEQLNYAGTNDDVVTWIHADPVSGSSSRTRKDGTLWYRTEYEPLGQEINVFGTDEEFPDPPDTGSVVVAADDPQWQCQVSALMNQTFFERPIHCQRAQIENVSSFELYPWAAKKEKPLGEDTHIKRQLIPGMDVPFAPSQNVLAFAKRSTNKPKKDDEEDSEDPDMPDIGKFSVEVDINVSGFVEASRSGQDDFDFSKLGKGRKIPTDDEAVRWSARNTLDDALDLCAIALKKYGLYDAVRKAADTAKILSVTGNEKITAWSQGFSNASSKQEKIGEYLTGMASTYGIKDVNTMAAGSSKVILSMNGTSVFQNKLGSNVGTYFFIHELVHHARGLSDDAIVLMFGLTRRTSDGNLESASNAVSRFFNSGCVTVK